MYQNYIDLGFGKMHFVSSYKLGACSENHETHIMIHGNSGSTRSFFKQMKSQSDENRIAIDLPGHGLSDNPKDDAAAHEIYSFNGYAKVVVEFIQKCGFKNVFILGWSLGGQIAYSMMKLYPEMFEKTILGVVTWGAPPVPDDDLMAGFIPFPEAAMMGQLQTFTEDEAKIFTRAAGTPDDAIMIVDAMRCDGRSRRYMIDAATTGGGVNARKLVEESDIPLCIIIGTRDGGVNNEYIRSLKYKNLFNGKPCELDTSHAVHFDDPERFAEIVDEFVSSIALNE